MKTLFMLLILTVFAAPLQANQPASQAGTASACLKAYDHYRRGYDISRERMMDFLNSCMPVNPVMSEQPLHRKLLQIIDDDRRIITLRT